MKVKIREDERYPYYYKAPTEHCYDVEIEMTDEEFYAWQKAEEELSKWEVLIHRRIFGFESAGEEEKKP